MQRPLRVLVLNERDPRHPAAGGAEVHVAEVARRLAADGFELVQLACSFAGAPEREEQEGLCVRRLGPLAAYYPRVVLETARETRGGRFDLVIEHLNKVPFCAAAYARVPVLAVSHHLFGRSAFGNNTAFPASSTIPTSTAAPRLCLEPIFGSAT